MSFVTHPQGSHAMTTLVQIRYRQGDRPVEIWDRAQGIVIAQLTKPDDFFDYAINEENLVIIAELPEGKKPGIPPKNEP